MRRFLQFLILLASLTTPLLALDAHAQAASGSAVESAPVAVPVALDNTVRYQRGNAGWAIVTLIWSLAVPAIILWTGMSTRIRDRVSRRPRAWFFMIGNFAAIYSFLEFVAGSLLLLILSLASAVTAPIELVMSRHHEREADRFALDLTHSNRSYAMALIKTSDNDRDPVDPDRSWIAKLLLDTHPSLRERIEFCNSYKPTHLNASPK